ncbi:MAG: cell surface protein SprA, partial [Rhodothermales bacterium]
NIRRPRTVKPFWFLENIPLLGVLGGIDFNYAPQSVSAGATAARNFSESQDRPRTLPNPEGPQLPELVEFPIRQTHALSHRRNGSIQYNPFQFLNLSFDANTSQSLNALGVDTLFSVIRMDSLGQGTQFDGLSVDEALQDGVVDTSDTFFQVSELRPVPAGQIVNRVFSGHEGLRADQHNESFTASFRPNISSISALDWISLQDVVYGSQFRWQNGSVGRNTGATAGNQLNLRGGVTLRPQELFRKIPLYTALERAQSDYEQEQEAERQRRQQAREQARAERERRRQEEEARREGAEQEAAERTPEDELQTPEDEMQVDGEGPPTEETADDEGDGTDAATDDEAEMGDEPAEGREPADDGGGFSLPLPNPVSLARQAVLAATGIRDMTITYSGNQSSNSSNVGTGTRNEHGELVDVESPYSLIDAISGSGPPVGYRFGLERTLPLDQRVISSNLQVTDALSTGHQIQSRATLNPSQALQINLTWNANWDENTNVSYRRDPNVNLSRTFSGSNRASVWAFNADYLTLFERQLETYRLDFNQADDKLAFGDANGDGRVVLTNESIVDDFQQTYLSGFGTVDGRGFLPFPMPNWQISYNGLGNWPLIRSLVTNATLRHGYSSDYSTDYRRNLASADSLRAFELSGRQIRFTIPEHEIGGVRVNERYQPLIGVDLTFRGSIQSSVAWEKSTAYSLSTTNFEVSQNDNSQITFNASYARSGLKLPFLSRLNNRISFSVTVSRANLKDQRLSLRRGLTDAISRGDEFVLEDALEGENVSVITASTRITVVPRISYQFSNRVAADFTLRYENFESEDSRQPSSTNINGGFNFRVSISN